MMTEKTNIVTIIRKELKKLKSGDQVLIYTDKATFDGYKLFADLLEDKKVLITLNQKQWQPEKIIEKVQNGTQEDLAYVRMLIRKIKSLELKIYEFDYSLPINRWTFISSNQEIELKANLTTEDMLKEYKASEVRFISKSY
ncbi:MAG: hypothetical protein HQL69_02435 [Magnetococcales bacterium]|nr:hypothetical protein [Magnetococcales bacterium]